ncbi:MAG: hypothetical protein AAF236_02635 [Verrucomicrobiota bacterium]
MAATLKIVTLAATFALALLLGAIFDTGYYQAGIIAKEHFGDKPLPAITLVLTQNHRSLVYVMLIPWIGFAGLPAFTRRLPGKTEASFSLRFAAFTAVESLLAVFLLLFLVLPFVPYYPLMDISHSYTSHQKTITGYSVSYHKNCDSRGFIHWIKVIPVKDNYT